MSTGNEPVPFLVVGLGNRWRRDDGVGPEVAERLSAAGIPGLAVQTDCDNPVDLIERWQGADCVFLVDALESGADEGEIVRLDATAGPIRAESFRTSTHLFGVLETVELARTLDRLPPRLILYGIVGEDFSPGRGLSAPLRRAADQVAARIAGEVRRR